MACAECGATAKAPERLVGRERKCPRCGNVAIYDAVKREPSSFPEIIAQYEVLDYKQTSSEKISSFVDNHKSEINGMGKFSKNFLLVIASLLLPGLAHFFKRRPVAGFFWLVGLLFLYSTTWFLLEVPAIALHIVCIYRGVTLPVKKPSPQTVKTAS